MGREMANALRKSGLDAHLGRLARSARSPFVRMIALKTQIEQRTTWPCGFERQWVDKAYGVSRRVALFDHRPIEAELSATAAIRLGLRDKSVIVRRMAADAFTERAGLFDDADALIETMRGDRSPGIRERADYLIRHRIEA